MKHSSLYGYVIGLFGPTMTQQKLVITLLLAISSLNGTAGDRDVSFGQAGSVITSSSSGNDAAQALLIEPDGTIITAGHTFSDGNSNSALARYHANGTLDTTFGSDGIATTSITTQADMFHALAHDAQKNIIAAGRAMVENVFYGTLARYKPDGTLDKTFGKQGLVLDQKISTINALAIYTDGVHTGKIMAAGEATLQTPCSTCTLTRYNADGSVDTSFGYQGIVATVFGPLRNRATCIALQPDDKILLAGGTTYLNTYEHIAIARYHNDGSPDETFGVHGQIITDFGLDSFINTIALQRDGKILVAGATATSQTDYDFALVRYQPNGTLDTSFTDGISGPGKVRTPFGKGFDFIHALALQADDKIIVAGQANMGTTVFALARYQTDGKLDESFGINGKVITALGTHTDIAYALALQHDGTIIAAGTTFVSSRGMDIALTRYINDVPNLRTRKSEPWTTPPYTEEQPLEASHFIRKAPVYAKPLCVYAKPTHHRRTFMKYHDPMNY